MTQESIALTYERATRIIRKVRQKASDLPPVRAKLTNVLKYLGKQAERELAESLTDDAKAEAAIPFLLLDKGTGKSVGNYISFDEAKKAASDLTFWEIWRNGTRLIVVRPGFTKEYKANI